MFPILPVWNSRMAYKRDHCREIWLDLEERFGKESAPRAYELRRAVALMHQEGMSVSAYYTKLRGIWDEIQSLTPKCVCSKCTCDLSKELNAIREKEHLYEFLMGLNDKNATIKTQILSNKPTPTLGTAYHLVAEDEQQKLITVSRKSFPEATAFQVSNKVEDQGMNSYVNRRDEKGRPDHRKTKKDGYRCTHCKKTWHIAEACFELVGYPPWWKGDHDGGRKQPQPRAATVQTVDSPIPGLTGDQCARLVQFSGTTNGHGKEHPMANMSGKIDFTDGWVIDSGATEHITYNESCLEKTTEKGVGLPVKIPNGDSIPIKNVGNTCLPNSLEITRVLNVPDFKCNLLPVSRLTQDLNCSLTFLPNGCVMQDLRLRNLIGLGRICDGLYYLELIDQKRVVYSVSVHSRLWHRRLGHASDSTLQKVHHLENFGNNGSPLLIAVSLP